MTAEPTTLETGRSYWITYECLDIGYGVESGHAAFVYCGGPDWTGKHTFTPVGGVAEIYLFPEEITDAWSEDA
jgi:hypothetical protein